ncbi:transcriptional regulator lytR [Mycobacteroides abscessus subsp. abscessus]|nr:transcriptional regulator lytR [Mycobacteroides abscessus subsp. abscessus]
MDAGRSALIQTVGRLTGVTVDRYAEVSMLGFVLMTDALGGVNVCLNEAVYEPMSGADFPAGPQTLDGPNALSFVRQRHDLPRGDLDRVVRQQVVMSSLAHSALSGGTLTNTTTLGKLRDAITRTVVLSQGWDVMDFIQQLQKLSGGNVAFATIPILREDGWTEDGTQSVVKVDPDQVRSWVSGLLDQQAQGKTEEATYSKDQTTADVVNETQINGLAAAVSELLVGKGFTAGKVGNNESDHVGSSQVQAAQQDDVGAKAVAEALGLPVVEKQGIAEHTVRVVLSKDYQGPGSGRETTPAASETGSTEEDAPPPPPSPIFTAANGPRCVN